MNKLLLLVLFSSISTIYAANAPTYAAPGVQQKQKPILLRHKRTTMQGCTPQVLEEIHGDAGETNVETNENAKEGAVRCCGKDYKVIGRAPWICVSPKSCDENVTYEKAKEICEGLSKELCTKQQMTIGTCCRTGCGFDTKATWVRN